ncbi:hypothetical protein [Kitasatospora sp. NPDC101183]|uniref:hypothetical protein n=1 Tax=Kitasatospora sp. NPDC101183 TaxID=3364100 RepID=UPI00382BFB23
MASAGSTGRRLLIAFEVLCGLVIVGCLWWGVDAFLGARESRDGTEAARAERLAGLSHQQHPGKGRYYAPAAAVLTVGPDGAPVTYLRYGAADTADNNVEDFLRTYDLPTAGTPAILPEDLRIALHVEQPAGAVLLPDVRAGRQVFVVPRPPTKASAEGVAADVYVRATGD